MFFNKLLDQHFMLKFRIIAKCSSNARLLCHHQIVAPENNFDIVINGGGIVGFALFSAFQSSPFLSSKRILLIEQQAPPKPVESSTNQRTFSNRVSSITLSSKEFFEQLGVWDSLQPYASKVNGMYVWSDHYQNGIYFPRDSYEETMCYILENNRMLQALHELTNKQINPLQKILYQTSVIDIHQDIDVNNSTNSISLKVIDINDVEQKHQLIQTKLLIGCDGIKSIVRSKSTLPYFEVDLEQMGIVGTLEIESSNSHNQVAFQRFTDNQLVIALLPLDERYSSLVLSLPKKNISDWMKLSESEFVSKLNNELIRETKVQKPFDKLASGFNLNKLYGNVQIRSPPTIQSMVSGSRAAFPLGFGTTIPFLVGTIKTKIPIMQTLIRKDKRANAAIIGDAAHRIHPLAGQGLNLGLGDANILTSCLDAKLSAGYEIFASTPDSLEVMSQALYEFERSRIMKLIPMLGAIHSMQTLFKFTPSSVLSVINQFEFAKKLIVSFANSR